MKYTINSIKENDVNVSYVFDDGSESTQTISISSYGGSAKEAAENYGRMYQKEMEPVKAREAALVAEVKAVVGKEFSVDVSKEPEAKPLV